MNQPCVVTLLQIFEKTTIYNTNIDLVNMMCLQNLVSFCQFVLKKLSKNKILAPIKDRNPVANLQNNNLCYLNVDLVNDNESKKLGLILSIRSQDIE